jgi:hypothetical protein
LKFGQFERKTLHSCRRQPRLAKQIQEGLGASGRVSAMVTVGCRQSSSSRGRKSAATMVHQPSPGSRPFERIFAITPSAARRGTEMPL